MNQLGVAGCIQCSTKSSLQAHAGAASMAGEYMGVLQLAISQIALPAYQLHTFDDCCNAAE